MAIKKIIIEVGGVELALSPEDAKELQKALNELFPAQSLPSLGDLFIQAAKTKKEKEYVPMPYPVPQIVPTPSWPLYPRPIWYCNTGQPDTMLFSRSFTSSTISTKQ